VILLDVVMPDRNGFQICRELKSSAEFGAIPVILVTSKDTASDRYWDSNRAPTVTSPNLLRAKNCYAQCAGSYDRPQRQSESDKSMNEDFHLTPLAADADALICSRHSARSKTAPRNRSTVFSAAAANVFVFRCWTSKKFSTGQY